VLLDAHTSLLREQEQRLQREESPRFSCMAGGAPPAATVDDKDWPTRLRHHIDTIVGAFRCDATRVCTLMFGVSQEGTPYTWIGQRDSFHSVAHGDAPMAKEQHFMVRTWQAQQIASLLEGLDAIKEGERTVLDNTVLLWICELGYWPWNLDRGGRHLRTRVASMIVGDAGGYFGTGRVVDVQQSDYCNLLLTMAHAMGYQDLTSFGKLGTKPLAELRRA
jgi:hypothetical protein